MLREKKLAAPLRRLVSVVGFSGRKFNGFNEDGLYRRHTLAHTLEPLARALSWLALIRPLYGVENGRRGTPNDKRTIHNL